MVIKTKYISRFPPPKLFNSELLCDRCGHGPEHIIKPAPGQIKYSPEENTLKLSFKPSLSYIITFVDPKYQVVSVHPTAIPKTIVKIGAESGVTLIYLKVIRFKCCHAYCFISYAYVLNI